MRARSTYSKSCSLRECGFDPLRLQDIENQSIVRFFRPSDGQKMAALFRPTNRQLTFAARQSGASSGLPVQSEARFIAVDQTLGLGQRRPAFNRRRCAQDGHVRMCPIAPLGLHISDLGQSRDLSVRENPFLIIVQDSGQTSILDDLDYLEFKDGSSLTPLDSLSLRFLLGFPFLTFPNEFLRSLSPLNGRVPRPLRSLPEIRLSHADCALKAVTLYP